MSYLRTVYTKIKLSKFFNFSSHFLTVANNNLPGWPKNLGTNDLAKYKRILVLAPHPDDETFGMGGTILRLNKAGCNIQISWMTNAGHPIRQVESEEVLNALHLKQNTTTSFPLVNRNILVGEVAQVIHEQIKVFKPDLICTTSIFESHIDHTRMNLGLKKGIESSGTKADILQYEVWSSLISNTLVDISDMEEKVQLMNLYKSQIYDPSIDYVSRITALNKYRGMPIPSQYAEAFLITSSDIFVTLLSKK